ncbi:MAG: HD-GYP domain-containing protein [Bacillota bacterium]|jgi:HD-GYP domain-containing protein (c-di-GMP phosphodiesterase class II)
MRIVALKEEIAGAILAMPVHGSEGQLLIEKGIRLTLGSINSLKRRGFTRVAIQDEFLRDVEVNDTIHEETRRTAIRSLGIVASNMLRGTPGDIQPIREALDSIIDDLRSNPRAAIGLHSICSFDETLYTHGINVCVLSIAIAEGMKLPESTLRQVGMGALLHDVGKILIPKPILDKPSLLTDDEYSLIKTHAMKGFEMLQTCYNVGAVAAHGALDHHERLDGSGYPRGLKGDNIPIIGRIVATADVYDAMVSERPHRQRHLPEAVRKYMQENRGSLFDGDAVDAMLRRVAAYPIGSILSLGGGFVAVVISQDPRDNSRPVVRVVSGPGITETQDIPLLDRPDLSVSMILDDYPPEARRLVLAAGEQPDIAASGSQIG